MKTIITGVQSTGIIHIGNYFGAIKPAIEMQKDNKTIIFIADLHALTTTRDKKLLTKQTLDIALDYLAFGLDPKKTIFFKQSEVKAHTELAWILSCITPIGLLERAHAYKDSIAQGKKEPTAGLFTYPILMASDILLYNVDIVPVGKDQKQHIEITRDIAEKFNNIFGETFKLPDAYIPKETNYIIGTDGNKMSKSYKNTISIFEPENILKKQIMSIKTDSTPIEEPKDFNSCIVFKTYSHFATPSEISELKDKYKKGGFGYGDAKTILFEKIRDTFKPFNQKRIELQNDLRYVETVLKEGAEKANKEAEKTLTKVKKLTGLY